MEATMILDLSLATILVNSAALPGSIWLLGLLPAYHRVMSDDDLKLRTIGVKTHAPLAPALHCHPYSFNETARLPPSIDRLWLRC